MREELLHARDARQAVIDRAREGGGTVVFASTCVPGAEKRPEGLARVFSQACERMASRLDAVQLAQGVDALGTWALFRTSQSASYAKTACVDIEARLRAGRLIDLDVYDHAHQVDRSSLGLPPRSCLVCERPAVECIRLGRHDSNELADAVTQLLAPMRAGSDAAGPGPRASAAAQVRVSGAAAGAVPRSSERLAVCLVAGARIELALTPKPGLVDRDDNGSHPDLSFHLMSRSIDLLPQYFDELLHSASPLCGSLPAASFNIRDPLPADSSGVRGPLPADSLGVRDPLPAVDPLPADSFGIRDPLPAVDPLPADSLGVRDPLPADPLPAAALAACVEAGRRAERRMLEAIGSNAHRGYIFLGGLALLGSIGGEDRLRENIRQVARAVADARGARTNAAPSHGSSVRTRHAIGGIEREALDGLPSVFEHGLPALRARRATHDPRRGADSDESLHYAMAVLMQVVEDTTAVYRCGPEGLRRLREDGRTLQARIEQDQPSLPWLRDLNDVYRRLNLTMGGVADCLALTVALDRWTPGV